MLTSVVWGLGSAATASIADRPYAITASDVSGGTFTPTNYATTYVDGALTVTAVVPLVVAPPVPVPPKGGRTTTRTPTPWVGSLGRG